MKMEREAQELVDVSKFTSALLRHNSRRIHGSAEPLITTLSFRRSGFSVCRQRGYNKRKKYGIATGAWQAGSPRTTGTPRVPAPVLSHLRLGAGFPAGLVVDQTLLTISQHEMPVAACDGLAPKALPRLYLHVCDAPPMLGNGRPSVGGLRPPRAQIIDGEVDGFRQR